MTIDPIDLFAYVAMGIIVVYAFGWASCYWEHMVKKGHHSRGRLNLHAS